MEIKIKELSNFCITCLSQDRKVVPLPKLNEFCPFNVELPIAKVICWECKAILNKIEMFKIKVLKAQELLMSNYTESKLNTINVNPLSNLKNTNILTFTTNSDAKITFKDDFEQNISHFSDQTVVSGHDNSCKNTFTSLSDVSIKDEVEDLVFFKEEDDLNDEACSFEIKDNEILDQTFQTLETDCAIDDGIPTSSEDNLEKILYNYDKTLFTLNELSESSVVESREKRRQQARFVKAQYKCESCICLFKNQKPVDAHNKLFHSEKWKFKCCICKQTFRSQGIVDSHRQNHYMNFSCNLCKAIFDSLELATNHYERMHHEKPRQCSDCDQTFLTGNELKRHRVSVHKGTHTCPHCQRQFFALNVLKRHLLVHSGMPILECDVCHKKYRGHEGLRQHKYTHEGRKNEDAYCAECDVQFSNKYVYRSHLKTSLKHVTMESLKAKCPFCEKRFQSQCFVDRHVESTHSEVAKYPCDICQRAYKTKNTLRGHIRSRHQPEKERKAICHYCSKAFKTKQQLRQHINTHTGERPFECKACGACFAYSGALYTHDKLLHRKLKRQPKARDTAPK